MERKSEWITAEQALTKSCQQAVESGLTLVWDRYGLEGVYQSGYTADGSGAVCVVGSYLIGKRRDRGVMPYLTASHHLNVSSSWVSGMEHGFAAFDKDDPSTRFHKDDLDGWEDGYDTGLRLRERFQPQTFHQDVQDPRDHRSGACAKTR